MKRPLNVLLTMLLLAGLLLVACACNSDKPSKPKDTTEKVTTEEQTEEDTTIDETTEEDTTAQDTTAVTTAASTTKAPDTSGGGTAGGGGGNAGGGGQSGGGSINVGGGGGGSQGGSTPQKPAANDGVVPVASSTKDAFPATVTTKSGLKLVHTYSDRAIGAEDNSANYAYMPMLSTTVTPASDGPYNIQKVLLNNIKPGLRSDGVMVGYDGYMFYEDTLADFKGEGFLHGEIYNRAVKMLKERNTWAESHGKKFYFVIAPNKNTVYPNYMPDGYTLASYRRYDQFVSLLRSAGITAVDLRETMNSAVRATPQRNLYYKYDTHWNNHAGFHAYQTTMNMIKKDFPGAVIHQKSEYQINYCETYMKDQAYYLGFYSYFKDYGPVYTLKGNSARLTNYEYKEGWGQFAFAYECTSGANRGYSDKLYKFSYTNDTNTSAPNAYIMRDSYSIAMVPFLKDSFHKSTYNWTFEFSEHEIMNADADVILVIVAERNLKSYVNQKPTVD